jgi:hypothetical protein
VGLDPEFHPRQGQPRRQRRAFPGRQQRGGDQINAGPGNGSASVKCG